MQQTIVQIGAIKLVGITVRTSYQNELDWTKGNILPCVQQYFHEKMFEQIPNRKKTGTTYCAYTEYENDSKDPNAYFYKGAYTYFIGEEVSESIGNMGGIASIESITQNKVTDNLVKGFSTLIIPAQKYIKFTTNPGAMPNVLGDAWQSIWHISAKETGNDRSYGVDFELYDERAIDHNNMVLDIYIGVNK